VQKAREGGDWGTERATFCIKKMTFTATAARVGHYGRKRRRKRNRMVQTPLFSMGGVGPRRSCTFKGREGVLMGEKTRRNEGGLL